MPTGYTAAIEKGISFERFIWDCAKAFGALVEMRDDPQDAKIPARFEPTDYHTKALAKARADLASIIDMTNAEAGAAAAACYAKDKAAYEERAANKRALREKYVAMRAKAEGWTPPSADHEGLKAFMVEQIDKSIDFDCSTAYMDTPMQLTGSEWRTKRIADLEHSIQYHHDEHAKEVARTEQRNAWLAALRASVPYPG